MKPAQAQIKTFLVQMKTSRQKGHLCIQVCTKVDNFLIKASSKPVSKRGRISMRMKLRHLFYDRHRSSSWNKPHLSFLISTIFDLKYKVFVPLINFLNWRATRGEPRNITSNNFISVNRRKTQIQHFFFNNSCLWALTTEITAKLSLIRKKKPHSDSIFS